MKVILAILGVGFVIVWFIAKGPDLMHDLEVLFSGLALLVLTYTVLLQQEELRLQRKELRETKEELKRSADAQTAQNSSMRTTALLNGYAAKLSHHTDERKYYLSTWPDIAKAHVEESDDAIARINELIADLEAKASH